MSAAASGGSGPDDRAGAGSPTSIVDLVHVLWRHKPLIAAVTALACVAGLVHALKSPNVYRSQAILAPKEQSGSGSGVPGLLSGLGGFGTMVTAQLGLGNTKVERLEYIANSREIAEYVIRKNGLLPKLYPPAPEKPAGGGEPFDTLSMAVEDLRHSLMKVSADPLKNILVISADTESPEFSMQLVNFYLEALNEKIKLDVQADADSNRMYLEKQLGVTLDPMVREKILHLIAMEIERSMLVSTRSLDVLQKPFPPMFRIKPLKAKIMMTSFFAGLLLSVFLVFVLKGLVELAAAIRSRDARPAPAGRPRG